MSAANCLVAMYHYVHDADPATAVGVNALAPRDFETQLAMLQRERDVLSFAAFHDATLTRIAFTTPAALLTFDDGLADHYQEVFPRLRAAGVSGVFFLAGDPLRTPPRVLNVHKTHLLLQKMGVQRFATAVMEMAARQPVAAGPAVPRDESTYRYDEHVGQAAIKHLLNYELSTEDTDRILATLFSSEYGDEEPFARNFYLTQAHIREMAAAGMTFGFHSEQHPVLSRLSAADQTREIAAGVTKIRALTAQTDVPFCYPYGHAHTFNADTLTLLQAHDYALAFTTVRRAARAECDSRFEIPRYDTRDLPPFGERLPDA